jgi:hypothetical protein
MESRSNFLSSDLEDAAFEDLNNDGGTTATQHTNTEGLPYRPRGMESRTEFLTSDLEETALADKSKHDAAQQILDQMEQMLSQADRFDNVTEDMLGSAIVRMLQDLADAIMLRIWTNGGPTVTSVLEDVHTLLLQEENAASSNRDTIPVGTI